MTGRPPSPSCVHCGLQVPDGEACCPGCGAQRSAAESLPTAITLAAAPPPAATATITSLGRPSPPTPINPGDGPFHAGQHIGARYTILNLLGTGGMGAVYQAFDHELGDAVAIKVIRPAAQSDA